MDKIKEEMLLFAIFILSIGILCTIEFIVCFYASQSTTIMANSTIILAITISGFLTLLLALIFTVLYFILHFFTFETSHLKSYKKREVPRPSSLSRQQIIPETMMG